MLVLLPFNDGSPVPETRLAPTPPVAADGKSR